jgi:stearoyl-CoA desaturase (delta-9 desaturase)
MSTTVTAPAVQGVVAMTPRQIKAQRTGTLVLALVPLLGFALALSLLWRRGFSPVDLGLLVGFYLLSGFGVTVGYHRLLTHRSFEAAGWLRAVFAGAGSLALEGSVIGWVADHRRHHAYSDRDGDPHSPHLEDGVLRGLWHAHLGWLFKKEATSRSRWAPDLLKDPAVVRVDRAFPVLAALSLLLPALVGGLASRSLAGAFTGLLWGGFARIFLVNHVTFAINSICHFYGKRPFQTRDASTNNWPLAILSLGESWHNNHHAFPTSAVHGLGRWQVDPSGRLILGLEKLGLARNVKRPTTAFRPPGAA